MSLLRTVYVGIGGAGGYIIKYHDNFFWDKLYLYLDGEKDLRHSFDELIGIKRKIYDKQNLSTYFRGENSFFFFDQSVENSSVALET